MQNMDDTVQATNTFNANWLHCTDYIPVLLEVILFVLLYFNVSFFPLIVTSSWIHLLPHQVLCVSSLLMFKLKFQTLRVYMPRVKDRIEGAASLALFRWILRSLAIKTWSLYSTLLVWFLAARCAIIFTGRGFKLQALTYHHKSPAKPWPGHGRRLFSLTLRLRASQLSHDKNLCDSITTSAPRLLWREILERERCFSFSTPCTV